MKRVLGETGIEVTPLCFGTLTMTPAQKGLSIQEGARLIVYAWERGIRFLDTAQYYENYAYIREALRHIPRDRIVIATKSYAWDKETAEAAMNEALTELGTDYIDLFLLHEQESEHTLRGHEEALLTFHAYKKQGILRGVGLSTHRIAAVKAGTASPFIDVMHPLYNRKGIGIFDGTAEEMEIALTEAARAGKGIYAMKALAGGHLIRSAAESLQFVLNKPFVHSVAVGMQSTDEIDCNIAIAAGRRDEEHEAKLAKQKRQLIVNDFCIGCGACERTCRQGAIRVIDGQAVVNEKCILCGYCAFACPEFAVKVV